METRRNAPIFNKEDRISTLPEPLIHHIVSFLDMTYVVQTCVLSRRWRYIWTTLPTLNFDDKRFLLLEKEDHSEHSDKEIQGFIDFVDCVLFLRESSDLQTFRLVCDCIDGYMINGNIDKWFQAAVRCNVQEVYFNRSLFAHTFEIPQSLLTCNSLTKLEINFLGDDEYKIALPSSMSLPRLKTLRLALPFDDERLTNMLFSSCPALESLIIDCYEFNGVNLNISAFELKHFELICYNAEPDCQVKLNAPNLTFFKCEAFVSKDFSLENLSSLVTADIIMKVEEQDTLPGTYPSELRAEKKGLYAHRMLKFLRALHNVKVLKLSSWFREVNSRCPQMLDDQPPQFSNLQCLKLRTWFSRDCMDAIIYLLKISPNIESLSLQIVMKNVDKPPLYPFCDEISFNSGNSEDYWGGGLLFPCMLYHLKFVEIRGLLGCVNELKFLEILLKNAIVLEKVYLFSSSSEQDSSRKEKRMKKFSDKLLSFPSASPRIVILFRF